MVGAEEDNVDPFSFRPNLRVTNDVECILTVTNSNVKVGEPIQVSLSLKYTGTADATYDAQSACAYDAFLVTSQSGGSVHYIGGSGQTGGSPRKIVPGQTMSINENLDLTERYLFYERGRYLIQFRGDNGAFGGIVFPKSNQIVVDVSEGEVTEVDAMILRLLPVCPQDWVIGKTARNTRDVTPYGRRAVPGCGVFLSRNYMQGEMVVVWQTTEGSSETGEGRDNISVQYIGEANHRHFYVALASKAQSVWPSVLENLKDVLLCKNR